MDATNVIKRYFNGQTLYWCGWGWSNVGARALRFDDLFDAYRARPTDDSEVRSIVLGPNLTRVFKINP